MRMYTGEARTHGALWPEESEHAWEFYADTPWMSKGLARGDSALLIVVDEENKEALEELALKISLGLMVERVEFPIEPPEIPSDYVPREMAVKGVVVSDGSDSPGPIQRFKSYVADFFQDELKRGDEPLTGSELFPPIEGDDYDDR